MESFQQNVVLRGGTPKGAGRAPYVWQTSLAAFGLCPNDAPATI